MENLWAVILAEEEKTGKQYAYAMQFDSKSDICYLLHNHKIRNLTITQYGHVARDRVKQLNEKRKNK